MSVVGAGPSIGDIQLPAVQRGKGVWLTTDVFEAAVARVREGIVKLFAGQVSQAYWAPPVIAAEAVTRTGYPESFPHLLGEVINRAGDATPESRTDLVLTPAACHHIYPLIADTAVSPPFCVAVEATCFRNEATSEAGRLRSFRMREVVLVDRSEACLLWRDESLQRARRWLVELGLDVTVETPTTRFLGRAAGCCVPANASSSSSGRSERPSPQASAKPSHHSTTTRATSVKPSVSRGRRAHRYTARASGSE
jgi:hypothetical protein